MIEVIQFYSKRKKVLLWNGTRDEISMDDLVKRGLSSIAAKELIDFYLEKGFISYYTYTKAVAEELAIQRAAKSRIG